MTAPIGGGFEPFDLLPEATVVIDRDGTVLHVNDRANVLLGLDDSAVGKHLADVVDAVDDTDTSVLDCLLPASPIADRLPERLVRVRLPDRSRRPVTVAGRIHEGVAVLTFRHAGRRVRLDLARSDLVATVSHEIRSPLTSVKGFTRTMLAKWERFSDDQKRQMLATINADADRVTRLLTELLDVSRIDAGRVQLHRLRTDVGAIIHQVVGKAVHHDDAGHVEVDVPEDLPALHVDPDKIEQVVTNLVDNALRHAPRSTVRISAADEGEIVRITVADEGPGVPTDQVRAIFGKFSRGRGNRRAGTGLGLYITRGLVEAHGGRVWVESEPGRGAAFHVALPKGGAELALRGGGDER